MEHIEVWKDVIGYEGIYIASSFGNIYRLGRVQEVTSSLGRTRYTRLHTITSKPIIPYYNSVGYAQVGFRLGGKRSQLLVSRVVYEAFCGPIPSGFVIDHVDDNPRNNMLNNLRCISQRENVRKSVVQGRGGHTGRKLSVEDVRIMRAMHLQGHTYEEMMNLFNVSHDCVCKVVNRRSWKNVR